MAYPIVGVLLQTNDTVEAEVFGGFGVVLGLHLLIFRKFLKFFIAVLAAFA